MTAQDARDIVVNADDYERGALFGALIAYLKLRGASLEELLRIVSQTYTAAAPARSTDVN